jgi:hypothetical protein
MQEGKSANKNPTAKQSDFQKMRNEVILSRGGPPSVFRDLSTLKSSENQRHAIGV